MEKRSRKPKRKLQRKKASRVGFKEALIKLTTYESTNQLQIYKVDKIICKFVRDS